MREQLRNYEQQNGELGDKIEEKDALIDGLENDFARKHEQIKLLVEDFIDLEGRQERMMKETQHNLALLRTETEKSSELNNKISTIVAKQKRRKGQWEIGAGSYRV